MIKKSLIAIFLLLVLIGCGGVKNPSETGGIEVINTNDFYVDTGINKYYHITALVQNTNKLPIKHARVNVTVVKRGGGTVVFDNVLVHPSRLAPGQRGGVDFSAGELGKYKENDFKVEGGSFVIDDSNPYVSIQNRGQTWEVERGYYKASATFKNIGAEQAKMYSVSFLYYDYKGRILKTGAGFLNKDGAGLKPGDSLKIGNVVAQPAEVDIIAGFDAVVDFS